MEPLTDAQIEVMERVRKKLVIIEIEISYAVLRNYWLSWWHQANNRASSTGTGEAS
jgi:hypothetical protein